MRIFRTVVQVLAIVSITLAGLELALHLTYFRYLEEPPIETPPDYYVEDEALGIDQAPGFPKATFRFRGPAFEIFNNSLGCFDREREVRPGYVLVVGDSFTWGYAPLEAMWTTLLEQTLGGQFVKCGVSGTGTRYQLGKARKVIERIGFPPAAIIVLHYDNDMNDDAVFPGDTVVDGQRVERLCALNIETGELTWCDTEQLAARRSANDTWIRKHTQRLFLLERVFRHFRGGAAGEGPRAALEVSPVIHRRYFVSLLGLDPETYPAIRPLFEKHLDSIVEFRRYAEGIGSRLIVFDMLNGNGPLRDEFRSRAASIVEYNYSLDQALDDPDSLAYPFNPHWTPRGNAIVAGKMANYLEENGVLD